MEHYDDKQDRADLPSQEALAAVCGVRRVTGSPPADSRFDRSGQGPAMMQTMDYMPVFGLYALLVPLLLTVVALLLLYGVVRVP